jgi:hypothetical protein
VLRMNFDSVEEMLNMTSQCDWSFPKSGKTSDYSCGKVRSGEEMVVKTLIPEFGRYVEDSTEFVFNRVVCTGVYSFCGLALSGKLARVRNIR